MHVPLKDWRTSKQCAVYEPAETRIGIGLVGRPTDQEPSQTYHG